MKFRPCLSMFTIRRNQNSLEDIFQNVMSKSFGYNETIPCYKTFVYLVLTRPKMCKNGDESCGDDRIFFFKYLKNCHDLAWVTGKFRISIPKNT